MSKAVSSTPAAPLRPATGRPSILAWLRRHAQVAVGVAISAWSIWQLAQAIDPAEVGRHLAGSNWLLLGVSFATIVLAMVVKAIRWGYLFPPESTPGLRPRLSSLYIGYLMNTVLPARVGEFVRAYLVGREPGVGVPVGLATVIVEKVLDLLTLGLILAVLIVFRQMPTLPGWLQVSLTSGAAALVAGMVGLVLMVALRRSVIALVAWLERRLPLLGRLQPTAMAASFLDTLAGLGRGGRLPGLVCWSVLVWALGLVNIWTGLAAVGLAPGLSALLLAIVVTNLGMAVPSAPGYVGVFHALLVESLLPYGIDRNHALGAAIVLHLLVFGNFVVGGIWFLWRGGHSLRGLRDASGH